MRPGVRGWKEGTQRPKAYHAPLAMVIAAILWMVAVSNSSVLISPETEVQGVYRKVHLAIGEGMSGMSAVESFPVFGTKIGEKVIFRENFSHSDGPLPANWWSEGDPAEIRSGRLHVNADTGRFRQSTVWLDRTFSGDLRVEYDVCVLASVDIANNVNFFFLYSDPSGRRLYETRQARANGNYVLYHNMNGYIFTNVANGTETDARLRFRDCPGFHLLAEKHQYENKRQTKYHITIEKRGNRFAYKINGNAMMETWDDQFNPVHQKGLMAVRTWHTELWLDDLVVTQLGSGE